MNTDRLAAFARGLQGAACLLAVPAVCIAQAHTNLLPQGNDVVQLPGVGRIVGAFVLVLAIGAAAVVVLRRFLTSLPRGYAAEGNVKVIARGTPAPGVRIFVLMVDQQRVLVAENRSALAVTLLTPPSQGSAP